MADEEIRYDRMVETALRGVVRDALNQAAAEGLPGDHHFYITFKTGHPGVRIPGYLRAQYADEMTIVLQYQYLQLEVDDVGFSVSLSFSNKHERLRIPFAAVTTFADPSVNFALQFQALSDEDMETGIDGGDEAGQTESGTAEGSTVTPIAGPASDTAGDRSGVSGRRKKSEKAKPGPTPPDSDEADAVDAPDEKTSSDAKGSSDAGGSGPDDSTDPDESKVVTLDKFRKK
ncbi:ClpXP protease specificity-enhancing factor SspB [Fodinicurvata sp. EGI_FJ10296]|uniref:SspB family protein n=1 Tax=Fodinicurvata sp. EGI_FJ10296 TaxID=3231908 RepID=UPI003451A503